MSSNSTARAEWQQPINLHQTAPDALTDATETLKGVLEKTNSIIEIIENIVKVAASTFSGPTDILSFLIKQYMASTLKVLQDSLSLGAGMIVIHPYNRMNQRQVNIFTKESPCMINAMTPAEAFTELYDSFSNKKDPYRPRWTDNVRVTGLGVLVVSPDPAGLVTILSGIQKLFDFKEFKQVTDKYVDALQSLEVDAKQQNLSEPFSFDISGVTGMGFKNIDYTFGAKTGKYQSLLHSNTLPSLHWYGLSLSNLTFLDQVIKKMETIIGMIVKFSDAQSNIIKNFANVLLRKIQAIKAIVKSIYDFTVGIMVALDSTGFYVFTIPVTPSGEKGGVNYVINSLKNSLSSPSSEAEKAVAATLNASDFSALLFMGTSVDINTTAWEDLFASTLTSVTSFADNRLGPPNFTVLPELQGAVFNSGDSFNLKVVSTDSTPSNPLYFTYSIKDSSGKLLSEFTTVNVLDENIAKVNQSSFKIPLPKLTSSDATSVEYTASIRVFNSLGIGTSVEYTFLLTNVVTVISSTLDSSGNGVKVISNGGGSLSLVDPSGDVTQKVYTSGGGVSVGTGAQPLVDMGVVFTTEDGESISIKTRNDTGYDVKEVDSLPMKTIFRFETFPGRISININGALCYREAGSTGAWTYIALPGALTISDSTNLDIMIYTDDAGWQGPYTLDMSIATDGATNVC